MAAGRRGGGSSSKKNKPLSKDPARLAAAIAKLSTWASLAPCANPSPPCMDLHTHSTCSDGLLSPTDIVMRAHRNGVKVLALTDHDTMAGVPVALKVACELGMRLIPGVEISAKFASSSQQQRGEEPVHILAYYGCCGPAHHKEIEDSLLKIRDGRYVRAKAMVQKLKGLNKPVKWESVLEIAGEGVAPCRPHVARALVEAGHVSTMQEAFSRYLHNSGPAYVAGAEQPAEDVVRLIHQTGGMAVLAHPWALKQPFPLIKRLKDAGLDGIEVFRSTGKDAAAGAWADAYNLVKVGGSDYHATGKLEETDIGGVSVPMGAMLQFMQVAQSIWKSALQILVQDFAEGLLDSAGDTPQESWKGDLAVREADGKLNLIFSPFLTKEEWTLVQTEATNRDLSHAVVLEQGFVCIAISKPHKVT